MIFKFFDEFKIYVLLISVMARDETSMADIPTDIQKHMLKLLATNNGASDFVRATARSELV